MAKAVTKKIKTDSATVTTNAAKTVEAGVEKVSAGIESAATFGQDNIEAIVTSSKIAAKAAESMSTEIVAYSKRSYEDGLAAAKELSSCRSVTEFVEKQTSFTKASLETLVDEAGRLNELYAAAAKEVMAPLNARLSATVGAFTSYRA